MLVFKFAFPLFLRTLQKSDLSRALRRQDQRRNNREKAKEISKFLIAPSALILWKEG